MRESGCTASRSKYAVQSGRYLSRGQVDGVYGRERVSVRERETNAGGDNNMTRLKFSVHICISVILIIVNKRSFKRRSEKFVAGSLGRG